ncbi:MAG: copper chaperone Copz family protein [Acidobacteria bacterium]|nr:copper chaperone Copz family protein [Acidobacteriota bacterium]
MSDCCSTASPAASRSARICPACQNKGKPVQLITVRSLVRPERRPEIQEIQHYYCPTPTCDIVYFSAATTSRFHKDNLTVRVGAKETVDPIPVCYCFGHTEGSIHQEIEATGKSSAEESIRAAIKAGECTCETSNPAGACCLGDVRAAIDLWLRKINARYQSEEVMTAVDNRTSAACCEPTQCSR